jgi:TolB-like protein
MAGKTLAAAVLGLLVVTPHVGAQSETRPTITVTPFTADRLNEASRKAGEQLGDDLAALLVESGRFRVLARELMPLPVQGRYPVATIRQAAVTAGVQYVVFGSMRTSTERVISSPPVNDVPTGRGQLFPRRIDAIPQRRVPRPRPSTKSITYHSVELELIDAASGHLVRTMRARSETSMETAMKSVAETLARLSVQLSYSKR